MRFQYQRHGINIQFAVTFFEIIAPSKQHMAPGYWRYPGKFINNLLGHPAAGHHSFIHRTEDHAVISNDAVSN